MLENEGSGQGDVRVERFVTSTVHHDVEELESDFAERGGIRPVSFADYPGQKQAKENLEIYVRAAILRDKPLDHVLLHGPPGLGKTTLAHIIAAELGVSFISTSGPSIDKPGDLAGILAGLEKGALLFIDEIHRLPIQIEEVLYSAMEDFAMDIVVGQGQSARSVKMNLPPFTLIGATTKLSSLSRPFLSRFGIQERLVFYDQDSIVQILNRSAGVLGLSLSPEGAEEIASRSRGTPRVANRFLRRASDFAAVNYAAEIDFSIACQALEKLEIDCAGLDRIDREILQVIQERYKGGPVGIEAVSISLGEERATIEEVYEPFLVYQGFVARGPRGRSITDKGRVHLGLEIE